MTKMTKSQRSAAARKGWRNRRRNPGGVRSAIWKRTRNGEYNLLDSTTGRLIASISRGSYDMPWVAYSGSLPGGFAGAGTLSEAKAIIRHSLRGEYSMPSPKGRWL